MAETMMKNTYFQTLNSDDLISLVGVNDQYLKLIQDYFDVELTNQGDGISLKGLEPDVLLVEQLLKSLSNLISQCVKINGSDVMSAIKMAQKGTLDYFEDLYQKILIRDAKGKPIRIKNLSQAHYVEAIKHHDVVFGIGPAGTGKTYLAVIMAISAFKRGEVERIILTRPAVEAGENLGFLPGDLKDKIDPYLRPIYDALYAIFGTEATNRLMEREIIEIAPLAYMRGRTLDSAFVILDEAQNTTRSQMKMFLTRLGFDSKMIVNGDITQVDLPYNAKSGLIEAKQRLQDISAIKFVNFSANDVVRNPVVTKIIEAYEKNEEQE
ncbi:PHOH-like protein [Holzapfeliella floricola DSM 23037 = JCM 16512]|uniref:PhoH-like protein n=2 Tax=Holzapfeliella TaxID=2767883 RepID=A0A0R2DI50_9LACO|nr:PHOH-like protein [Holzapfeliella floricola DSM 23037 = JCM 16512]